MIRIKTVINLVSAGFLLSSALADDWPQWQGPNRNAISRETDLLKKWPKDGPPLAWKITGLGGGDSAPSISAGRIYGMGNRGEDEVVWARSEKDGKELRVSRLGPAFEQRGMPQSKEGPGGTPTVDGERLYVIGMGGDISCLQVSDGKILWQKSMARDFGGRGPTWSFRESPLVDGDKVICTPGAQDAMLVALDKLTGNTIWKTAVPASPASPAGETGGPGGGRGRFGQGVALEQPTLRSSPSLSKGSASTSNSPRRDSSGSRLPTASSSGDMTVPPTAWASTVPPHSTTMAGCSQPRPMVRAVAWQS